jgi:hypothetical protein
MWKIQCIRFDPVDSSYQQDGAGMADSAGFLERARNHLDRVRAAAPDPTDWYDLTIYGFYCVEAAVMAASAHDGMRVEPNHPSKATAAQTLARTHGFPDVSGLLRTLNAARKATAYGDRELPRLDPVRLAREIERYVQAVAKLIEG